MLSWHWHSHRLLYLAPVLLFHLCQPYHHLYLVYGP